MTPRIALGFEGVIVPPGVTYARTTCPKCSPRRAKSWERCVAVTLTDDSATAYCHHCEWETSV